MFIEILPFASSSIDPSTLGGAFAALPPAFAAAIVTTAAGTLVAKGIDIALTKIK